MPLYRVAIDITGVVRIDAPNKQEAMRLANKLPYAAGKKHQIYGLKTKAQVLGLVEVHQVTPDSCRQKQKGQN